MSFLKKIQPQDKFIFIFILKAIALYLVWFLLYENWLVKDGFVDHFLIEHLVDTTSGILKFMGFTTFEYADTIGIDGTHGVIIGVPCNGMDLFALFAGFILLFPGNKIHKLLYILSGLLFIHILNILRLVGLALVVLYKPESLGFNHKYTFTIIIYCIVFLLWVVWIKKFSTKSN